MSRSWFYLTLWRGTPPEFTDNFDTQIHDEDEFTVSVQGLDEFESNVDTSSKYTVEIESLEMMNTDITTSTGVVWYVG